VAEIVLATVRDEMRTANEAEMAGLRLGEKVIAMAVLLHAATVKAVVVAKVVAAARVDDQAKADAAEKAVEDLGLRRIQ